MSKGNSKLMTWKWLTYTMLIETNNVTQSQYKRDSLQVTPPRCRRFSGLQNCNKGTVHIAKMPFKTTVYR